MVRWVFHGRLMSNAPSNIVNEEELAVVHQNTLLAFCHTGPTKSAQKNRSELKIRSELKFILVYMYTNT